MSIERHAFKREMIEGADMFRLPARASSIYVGQNFVDALQASGLIGLEFKQVWSDSNAA